MSAPKSCATCDKADTAWRDDDLVLECHLNPPMTMPSDPDFPPLPEVTVSVEDDEPVGMEIGSFAAPHRYPVVTDSDWCSWWTARSDT